MAFAAHVLPVAGKMFLWKTRPIPQECHSEERSDEESIGRWRSIHGPRCLDSSLPLVAQNDTSFVALASCRSPGMLFAPSYVCARVPMRVRRRPFGVPPPDV